MSGPMKSFVIFSAALSLVFLLNACAHNEISTETPTTSAASVPGEKLDNSGGGMQPGVGAGGATGNVRF
jgi:hypothetical protein